MLAPMLLGWRLCVRMMSELALQRNLPDWVHARQKFDVEWQCENQRDRTPTWSLNIQDRLRENETQRVKKAPEVTVTIPQILPAQKEFATYRCLFPRRGKYVMGPSVASTSFPLGVIRGTFVLDSKAEIFVAPALGKLVPSWDKQLRSEVQGEQAQRRRRGIDQDDFYSLREWRVGDSSRQIHWRTSAKLGKPVIKQFDQNSGRDFALAVDLYSDGTETEGLENIERVLSCAATMLASLTHEVQGKVAVSICGQEPILISDYYNRELVSLVMQNLAIAQAGTENQLGEMIGQLVSKVSTDTPVLVLSTRPKPESLEQLIKTNNPAVLRSVQRLTVWVQAGTSEFNELFQMPNETAVKRVLQSAVSEEEG